MPLVTWIEPGEGTNRPLRLKTKLRAWWEGYDVSALERAAREVDEAADYTPSPLPIPVLPSDDEPLTNAGKPLWTASRIAVAETLWGQDFLSPGGVEHTTYLVKPFGINPSMSLLDLSAGLGGVSRTIAAHYKAWVTGMESSPLVAKVAMDRSEKAGFGKQAPVLAYDPNALALDRRYDGIFCKESFFTIENKDKLFDTITSGLKPGGQFLFTDYCTGSADPSDPRLSAWKGREPVTPHIWAAPKIAAALKARKLDVRIHEDMTDMQRKLILRSLGHFLEHLDSHSMPVETKRAVMDEVELWARRMAAFDAGLRVYRFYCMKH